MPGEDPIDPLPVVLDWARAAPAVSAMTEAAVRRRRVILCSVSDSTGRVPWDAHLQTLPADARSG